MTRMRSIAYNNRRALVAQGIERLPPEQKVVGSNPIEGTIFFLFYIPSVGFEPRDEGR